MKKKLQQSLKRDEILFQLIKKYNTNLLLKNLYLCKNFKK
jgi:hypothetical protein